MITENIDFRQLKKEAQTLLPLVHVGKSGLSDAVLLEIVKQLRKHHLVKIKFLKNFIDERSMTKRELGEELAGKTGSMLISIVGNTVVVFKL